MYSVKKDYDFDTKISNINTITYCQLSLMTKLYKRVGPTYLEALLQLMMHSPETLTDRTVDQRKLIE